MQIFGTCKRCRGQMAILDILMEGYDLICARCGDRETVHYRLPEPPACFE